MNRTSIEWTHRPETGGAVGGFTWNPIRARRKMLNGNFKAGTFCTRISPGCQHCYASIINKRFGTGAEYTVPNLADHEFYIDEKILAEPLKRKKPATIFVGDMFDLFHEAIPPVMIFRVWDVMQRTSRHTFQVLTKRAKRMHYVLENGTIASNIWLGVSVEDQQRADERIPPLLQMPAAIRFISYEPALEGIDIRYALDDCNACDEPTPHLDWVICGGESGPGARPFNLTWAESLRDQCKAAGVPFFMKQVGSNPTATGNLHGLACTVFLKKRSKGGDISEWPASLRVREFPRVSE